MTIGRNNSRRRRVFLDETVQSSLSSPTSLDSPAPSQRTSKKTTKAYSPAGKRAGQLKTTDLIPKQAVSILLVVGICVGIILVINFLAINSKQWNNVLSGAAIQSLSFSGVGSISGWFSSFLLMITGMASLQIYGMRRHRCDDYSGAYRIWLWMAVLFVLASINCVVDFRSIVDSLAQYAGYSGGKSLAIFLSVKFVALTALVIRGVLEIRASRGALIAVILVWVAYTSAIVTQIPAVDNDLVWNEDVFLGNSILIGTLAAFVAVLSYARFVYLHANELIQLQQSNAKRKNQKTISVNKNKNVNSERSSDSSKIADDSNNPPTKKTMVDADTNQEILSLAIEQNLSKSERRRLRKLQKRQRRAA